jgi:serine/threonine protein kinase
LDVDGKTAGPDPLVELIIGEKLIAERYESASPIRGGRVGHFSMTFQAIDRQSRETVVLKFLDPRVDDYRRVCFEREIDVATDVRGRDNVVQLIGGPYKHTIPVTSTSGIVVPYLLNLAVFECAKCDFGALLLSSPHLGLMRRLEIVRDIIKGINRLHNAGYCHRDIKPDNCFIFRGGGAKVGDYGTCRLLDGTDAPLLDDYEGPVGDVGYAAPELLLGQWNDKDLFATADWFSVGSTLFEAITGVPLYSAIGLTMEIGEIVLTFRALDRAQRLSAFNRLIGDIAGQYPIPRISDFAYSRSHLAGASKSTIDAVDRLVRMLCHFDHRRREKSFLRILAALDIAKMRAGIDERTRAKRHHLREPTTAVVRKRVEHGN